ncbi:MAG: outer membrane protein transport protein [Tannerellaceae bacterium]|nr:outer membrane protein transport protein [Tannerellaceae bacterium]
MRKTGIVISALVFVSSAVFSQGQLDAYKYSQTDLSGTARYLGMGGAFGALGGDISVMTANPAGLAVYRSSEIVTTLSLRSMSGQTDWRGSTASGSRAGLNFDNIAYVTYFPTSNDAGILGWNAGFSYNRIKDYNRNYSLRGMGDEDYSITDYIAERANARGVHADNLGVKDGYNPYAGNNDWLSVLGYDAVLIDAFSDNRSRYFSAFGEVVNGGWNPFKLAGRELNVTEKGSVDQYNIAFGLNIANYVMLGADVAITDIDYRYHSYFEEVFVNNNSMILENALTTKGEGYAFNVGVIVRPVNFLRLGIAYNSPSWYKMSDFYRATAKSDTYYWKEPVEASTPEKASYDYKYRSPDRLLLSAALIIGQSALLSVDYERTNYGNTKMYNLDGVEDQITNGDVKANFGSAGTLRIGGELKVTPRFAVRAGAAWIGSPVKDVLKNASAEVYTVGTIPHYTIERGLTNYTLGLGYRFTPSFYIDLAYVLKSEKEDLYAFSNIYDTKGSKIINSPSASLKTSTTQVALTLGFKF